MKQVKPDITATAAEQPGKGGWKKVVFIYKGWIMETKYALPPSLD